MLCPSKIHLETSNPKCEEVGPLRVIRPRESLAPVDRIGSSQGHGGASRASSLSPPGLTAFASSLMEDSAFKAPLGIRTRPEMDTAP
jgi:hypothetical protein